MNECWNWSMLRSEIVFIVLPAVVIAQPVVLAHDNPPYTTYSSFSDLTVGEDVAYPKLVRVSEAGTRESPNYTGFFFYQCQQFDPTDRYMLGMRVHCQNRDVRPTDRAEIGLIDLQDGYKWIRIGDTTAWNWQQGSRLQWRPGSNEVLWNDRSDDGRRYVCRAYDFKTGARRTLPRPVYIPSPDGDVALTHDFERMKHGGTPYVGIEDEYADQYAPPKTGIWTMDLNTGDAALIMSLDQMARIAYPGGAPSSGCVYFFREGWNPSGSRFVAFVKDPDDSSISIVLHHAHFMSKLTRYFEGLEGRHNVKLVLSWHDHRYWKKSQDGITYITGAGIARSDRDCDAMMLQVYKDHLRLDRYVVPDDGSPRPIVRAPEPIWTCEGNFSEYRRPELPKQRPAYVKDSGLAYGVFYEQSK